MPIEVLEANASGGLAWRFADQIDRAILADKTAQLLKALVTSGAGKHVLRNLEIGIGTDTDEGRAWLEASRLVAGSTTAQKG